MIDYSEGYVTGKGTESLSSDAIRGNLLREFSMAGGNYQLSVFPITTAYVNSYARETAEVKALSKRNAKYLNEKMVKSYLKNKACISADITVKEFAQVKNLENWKVIFIDSNNIAYKLDWQPEEPYQSKTPETITTTRNSYHGKEKMWVLSGKACSVAKVELREGFKLVFKPDFVQWPFDDEFQEEWTFNYTKVVDGKKVEVKKKERKKQGYRGW